MLLPSFLLAVILFSTLIQSSASTKQPHSFTNQINNIKQSFRASSHSSSIENSRSLYEVNDRTEPKNRGNQGDVDHKRESAESKEDEERRNHMTDQNSSIQNLNSISVKMGHDGYNKGNVQSQSIGGTRGINSNTPKRDGGTGEKIGILLL